MSEAYHRLRSKASIEHKKEHIDEKLSEQARLTQQALQAREKLAQILDTDAAQVKVTTAIRKSRHPDYQSTLVLQHEQLRFLCQICRRDQQFIFKPLNTPFDPWLHRPKWQLMGAVHRSPHLGYSQPHSPEFTDQQSFLNLVIVHDQAAQQLSTNAIYNRVRTALSWVVTLAVIVVAIAVSYAILFDQDTPAVNAVLIGLIFAAPLSGLANVYSWKLFTKLKPIEQSVYQAEQDNNNYRKLIMAEEKEALQQEISERLESTDKVLAELEASDPQHRDSSL